MELNATERSVEGTVRRQMMLRKYVFLVIPCALLMGCGGTYHYYTDPSPTLQNDRYQYVKFHPSAPHNNQILSGKIQKGMSREEIEAAWGSPTAIPPGNVRGVDEVWAYHDPDETHGKAVDFDPGVVAPRPVTNAKAPSVPRATHDAFLQLPGGE